MGIFLYHVIIRLYDIVLSFSSLFNKKAKKIVQGRNHAFETIDSLRNSGDRVIWMHCASLGEFEQGRPILEKIKDTYPEFQLFISFFSSSGYDIQQDYKLAKCVFYLPADSRSNAQKLVSALKPEMVLFIKYEFWHHYINECSNCQIPFFSISTILRPSQVFFSWYGGFYLEILKRVTHFFVQNEETSNLLKMNKLNQVTLSGDTRFDRVAEIAKNPKIIPEIQLFKRDSKLIVLGSVWQPDIEMWAAYLNNGLNFKYVIAPHNINEASLLAIERIIKRTTIRFSEIHQKSSLTIDVIIVDNIGMLSSMYSFADIAYVGGAFGQGLHNILEPATFGIPVLFGKGRDNYKYQESNDLVKAKGAFEIENKSELKQIMDKLEKNEGLVQETGRNARQYIERNLGATDIIMNHLKYFLEKI